MNDFGGSQEAHDEYTTQNETVVNGSTQYVITKKALLWTTVILGVALVVLIAFLLRLLQPSGFEVNSKTVEGIKAELVVTGPKKGLNPSFKAPMGSAWSPDGSRFYVADTGNDRICVFDRRGHFIKEWGGRGMAKPVAGYPATWKQGQLNYPTDVATDSDGNVYVADFYNDSISVFDSSGKFQRRFPDPQQPVGKGSSGAGGRGIAVTALTVVGDRVYATDTYQIVVFTRSGRLLQQFGMPGNQKGELDHPNGVAVGGDGTVFVSDSNNNRVAAFDRTGKLLWVVGKPVPALKEETTSSQLVLPRGMTILDDGSLLVADPLGQQLADIDSTGKVKAIYGQMGVMPSELNFPNDVASYKGKILVADRQNNRVQVVRLVRQ